MIKNRLKLLIKKAIKKAQRAGKLPQFKIPEIELETPKIEKYGDYSSPIALKVKIEKKDPIEIAKIIASFIESPYLQEIKVEKPGFINFFLKEDFFYKELKNILRSKNKYGTNNLGRGKKVQIEFLSANPTGPLTLGNGRGAFFGDVLANILEKSGYKVQREYYINDMGTQVELLGKSIKAALQLYKKEENFYKGEYINNLAKRIKKTEAEKLSDLRLGQLVGELILKEFIKPTVKKAKVKFDKWFKESDLYKKKEVKKFLNFLKEKKLLVYKEGAIWLFDWVLIKKDLKPTYFLSDLVYHLNKEKRGFDWIIDIWGADHAGHKERLEFLLKKLKFKPKLDIIIYQLVRLVEGKKEVKISKRKGTYVTLDWLLKEVGQDVCRFFFLIYGPNTHLDFDLKLAKERSSKNPVYYVQYAYARIRSILRKSKIKNLDSKFLHLLKEKSELDLIKELIKFPDLVMEAASELAPYKLPFYSISLADKFHQFYESCKVLSENKKLTKARLALVKATEIVLRELLKLMGISSPSKM